MPTFPTKKGDIFIPAHRIFQAETAPGGLSSLIMFAGHKPGDVLGVEVEELCKAVGEKIDRALAGQFESKPLVS